MAMGHNSDKFIRRKGDRRERKRMRRGKDGGRERGRKKYTSDQYERKRTVVTTLAKCSPLAMVTTWFDNLMKTLTILCKTYTLQRYKKDILRGYLIATYLLVDTFFES